MKKIKRARVSYIVTTKNRAKFFRKTLKNIREMLTVRDEFIVIDGGSTDGTKQLIKKNKDIITHFVSEKDFGEAHALNKGILLSSGEIIKILTDDDYFYPKAMKYALSILEKNPDIDALQCGGEAYIYNEKTKQEDILFYEQIFPEIEIATNLKHIMTYCPCGLGLIFRRSVLARTGLFDTTFRAVDLAIISQLILCKTNFKYLNISLYRHVNYAHSGENYGREIKRDEARVFIDHHMWSELMSIPTEVLVKVFGLDQLQHGTHLVRIVKFMDVLRRNSFSFVIIAGGKLLEYRRSLFALKKRIGDVVKRRKPQPFQIPISPIRDGRFW